MEIEIKNIDFDADSTIKLESRKETKRWSKFSNQFVPVVEKIGKNKENAWIGPRRPEIGFDQLCRGPKFDFLPLGTTKKTQNLKNYIM